MRFWRTPTSFHGRVCRFAPFPDRATARAAALVPASGYSAEYALAVISCSFLQPRGYPPRMPSRLPETAKDLRASGSDRLGLDNDFAADERPRVKYDDIYAAVS